jgi:hypothetical protein
VSDRKVRNQLKEDRQRKFHRFLQEVATCWETKLGRELSKAFGTSIMTVKLAKLYCHFTLRGRPSISNNGGRDLLLSEAQGDALYGWIKRLITLIFTPAR